MKKTFLKSISLICAAIMTLSAMSACQSEDTTTTPETTAGLYTVTFNSNGGTPVPSADVFENQTVSEPTPPTRNNYVFHYWQGQGRTWVFHLQKITEDVTLNAVWIPAHEIFKTSPAENQDETYISGFAAQKNLSDLTVPETINGKTVIGLAANAFDGIHEEHAHHLTLPKTLKYVEKNSFSNIKQVHIEFTAPIHKLGESSFENCLHLESIELAEGMTEIPYNCFAGASGLEEITIPEKVTTVRENAFLKCSSLSMVYLPSTLTLIEDSAFSATEKLSVVIYKGTKDDFEKITIENNNEELLAATIYFYSETPVTEGNFWHYNENNVPEPWSKS